MISRMEEILLEILNRSADYTILELTDLYASAAGSALATIYDDLMTTLNDMEKRGLIASCEGYARPIKNKATTTYFKLTDEGRYQLFGDKPRKRVWSLKVGRTPLILVEDTSSRQSIEDIFKALPVGIEVTVTIGEMTQAEIDKLPIL